MDGRRAVSRFGVVVVVSIAAWIAGCHELSMVAGTTPMVQTETGFVSKSLDVRGESLPYVVYVPEAYTPERSWPAVLFLHGFGERGTDGWKQTETGIGKALLENPERFECVVILPQCRPPWNWQGPMAELAMKSLDRTVAYYNIDEDRVALTGLSMGGFGTWRLGSVHRERFSCLVPICGGGDPTSRELLAGVPVWCWHGADDPVIPVDRSQEMVRHLRQAGGDVRYTELPGVEHNAWDEAYGNAELIAWMLRQTRSMSEQKQQ